MFLSTGQEYVIPFLMYCYFATRMKQNKMVMNLSYLCLDTTVTIVKYHSVKCQLHIPGFLYVKATIKATARKKKTECAIDT